MPTETEKQTLALSSSFEFYAGAEGIISIVPDKGLVQRGSLTWPEWWEAFRRLLKVRAVSRVAIADHLANGRREHGDVLVEEALGQLEFPVFEASRAEAIAKIPWSARNPALEDTHYFVTGQAELTSEERVVWLEKAVEEKLTPLELKRSIDVGEVQHHKDTPAGMGTGSGILTIYAVRGLYLQWARGNKEPLLVGPIDEQIAVLREMEPIVELIDKLRANIAAAPAPDLQG